MNGECSNLQDIYMKIIGHKIIPWGSQNIVPDRCKSQKIPIYSQNALRQLSGLKYNFFTGKQP